MSIRNQRFSLLKEPISSTLNQHLLVAFGGLLTTHGWIGCQPVEAPFVTIGQISPFVFFLFFAITPILGRVGRGIPNYYTDETD